MTNKYDAIYLSLLAVLGLESGCARTSGAQSDMDATESTEQTEETGDGAPDLPDEPPTPYTCANPVQIMQAGASIPSGFVQCDGGFVHRVEAVECVVPQADDEPACAGALNEWECSTTADCVDQPYGSCQHYSLGESFCECKYGCASDADCPPAHACVCAGVFSSRTQCIPAVECLTDTDCADGLCGISKWVDDCSNPHYSLACAGSLDECHSDADCGEGPCPQLPDDNNGSFPYSCNSHASEGFACEAPAWCASGCGRPFYVAQQARTASLSTRDDWCGPARLAPVDADTAAQLAEHWTTMGLLEHASIAAFARMCLRLMQLGAPPSLLLATRAALSDEIEHARLTFGLASCYAGHEIGPGSLEVAGSLDDGHELHVIVEGLVHEACVEETLAAIEASEAASRAEDPCVAAILEQIAADELSHARLAWQTLRWILESYPEIRDFALTCLDAAIAEARQAVVPLVDTGSLATLRRNGVLDGALRQHVRRAALAAVLEPCAQRLRGRPFELFVE